jgi:hypothetical protein
MPVVIERAVGDDFANPGREIIPVTIKECCYEKIRDGRFVNGCIGYELPK